MGPKYKYDVGFLIPAIRTHWWAEVANTIKTACAKYSYQILFVSPFDLPEELQNIGNISVLKSHSTVTISIQRGMLELNSDLVVSTTDDGWMQGGSIDAAVDLYNASCTRDDAISLKYTESGNNMPDDYWRAMHHDAFHGLGGMQPDWKIAMQFLMDREKFIEMGGFDCQFEYSDKPVHDLIFRLQHSGGRVLLSPTYCFHARFYRDVTGDHAPVHLASVEHDHPIFRQMYSKSPAERVNIDYDNWKQYPEIWERRFGSCKYNSYPELAQGRNYQV